MRVDGVVVVGAEVAFTVVVKWPELKDPPCAIYYKVMCQLEGEKGWKTAGRTTASYDTSITTEVLKPGATYAFQVVPVKSISHQEIDDLKSLPISAVIASAIPSTPPQNVTATEITDDTIKITWSPPGRPNGELTMYKIVYDTMDDDTGDYSEVHLPPDHSEHTLIVLESGTNYRIQMLACTTAGEGVCSPMLNVTTHGGAIQRWGSGPSPAQPAAAPGQYKFQRAKSSNSITGRAVQVPNAATLTYTTTEPPRPKRVGSKTGFTPMYSKPSESDGSQTAGTLVSPEGIQHRGHIPRRRTVDNWLEKRRLSQADAGAEGGASDSGGGAAVVSDGPADAASLDAPSSGRSKTLRGFVHYGSDSKIKFGREMDELYSARPLSSGVSTRSRRTPSPHKHDVELKDGMYVGKYDGGTIRGKKNGVRKSLRVITGGSEITDDVLRQLYSVEHRDKIVVYTTTLTAVRATLGACDTVMKLLDILRLKVQVKDVYKSDQFARELARRKPGAEVPFVFVKFDLFAGGVDELVALHEQGGLLPLCEGVGRRPVGESNCSRCGGAGFFMCSWCQGSGKSRAHNWGTTNKVLRCTVCSENGLQKCPDC
eukprot:m.142125 g.142125  ORF g.142125 m.142125 type:complete len:597 (-) comp22901_c0_seq1:1023-2813(-)